MTAAVVPVPAEHPLSTRVSQRPVPGSPGFAARSVRTGPGSAFRPSHRRLRLGSSAAFCLSLCGGTFKLSFRTVNEIYCTLLPVRDGERKRRPETVVTQSVVIGAVHNTSAVPCCDGLYLRV